MRLVMDVTEVMYEECNAFFDELATLLSDRYEVVDSCNDGDGSRYLIPKGSMCDLTYESKPRNSFRVSDHWNWFASERKNEDLDYIQCYTKDLPAPNRRKKYWTASDPIQACSVAYYGPDDKYHICFGEKVIDGKRKFIRHPAAVVAKIV